MRPPAFISVSGLRHPSSSACAPSAIVWAQYGCYFEPWSQCIRHVAERLATAGTTAQGVPQWHALGTARARLENMAEPIVRLSFKEDVNQS